MKDFKENLKKGWKIVGRTERRTGRRTKKRTEGRMERGTIRIAGEGLEENYNKNECHTSPVVATKPVIPMLIGNRTSDVPLRKKIAL